jgi:hypothetical protein
MSISSVSSVDAPGDTFRSSCWTLTFPLLAVLVWSTAFYGYIENPSYAEVMVCLVMPLCCLWQVARTWSNDLALSRQVMLYLACFAWTAVSIVIHPGRLSSELGWLGIECAGLATFLAVATCHGSARQGFLIAGTASVCAMGVTLTGTMLTHSTAFGMGNINYLLCCCDPPLYALAIWSASRWWHGQRMGFLAMLMPVIGLGLILIEIGYYHYIRRGSLLAGVAALVAICFPMMYRRLPRISMALGIIALVSVLVVLMKITAQTLPSFRFDRVYLYKSVLERCGETWISGNGPYAALGLQECRGEIARHWIAVGHWTDHAHNELLEAVLGGGVVAGALWIAAFTGVVARVRRISDMAERNAASALLAALFVHAMTDNSYSVSAIRLMMYGMIGLIFRCQVDAPATPARWTSWWETAIRSRLPSPRMLAALGGCAGAAVAYRELPGATTLLHAPPSAHVRIMAWSVIPADTCTEFSSSFNQLLQDGQLAQCKKVVDLAQSRIGMMGPVVTAQQQLAAARLGFAEASPERWNSQSNQAHELEINASVAADCQCLATYGFSYATYLHLGDIIQHHPEAKSLVSGEILRRVHYLTGEPETIPSLQPHAVTDMDHAIDRYAELCWWTQYQQSLPQAQPALLELVAHYGDVSEVSALGLTLAARAQPDAGLFDHLRPALALGLVIYSTPYVQAGELAQRASEAEQAGHLPEFSAFVASLYPTFWQEFVHGTAAADEEDLDVRAVCMQLFALSQRVSHGSPH